MRRRLITPLILIITTIALALPQAARAQPDTVTIVVAPGNWQISTFGTNEVYTAGETVQITASEPLRIKARFDATGRFWMNNLLANNPWEDDYWTLIYPRSVEIVTPGLDDGYFEQVDPDLWIGNAPDNFHLKGASQDISLVLFIDRDDLQGRTIQITFTRIRR